MGLTKYCTGICQVPSSVIHIVEEHFHFDSLDQAREWGKLGRLGAGFYRSFDL